MNTPIQKTYDLASLIFFICFVLSLTILGFVLLPINADTTVGKVLSSNILHVGVLESRTNQKELQKQDSIRILEDIARQFSWKITIHSYTSIHDMYQALDDKKIDLVADAVIDHRTVHNIRYSTSYAQSRPRFVYFDEITAELYNLQDIANGQLQLMNDSWQSHYMENLRYDFPNLQWSRLSVATMEDMIEHIKTSSGYTLATKQEFAYYKELYPSLRASLRGNKIAFAYAFHNDSIHLEEFVSTFIQSLKKQVSEKENTTLSFLLTPTQLKTFLHNAKTRLPKYVSLFADVGEEYGVDWRLLAAISYQESLWNEKAVSPTGVRGLMMLTQVTAQYMGVTKRTDPWQSVDGGTRYVLYLKKKLPKEIREPDKTWLALAAYNIGPSHLKDVQTITKKRGGDANSWHDVRENLPLIEQRKWYKKSKHGYARGREARTYVDNIRNYYHVLLTMRTNSADQQTRLQSVITSENSPLPRTISVRY